MSMILTAFSIAMLPITGLQYRQRGWIPGQVVAPRKPLLDGKFMELNSGLSIAMFGCQRISDTNGVMTNDQNMRAN